VHRQGRYEKIWTCQSKLRIKQSDEQTSSYNSAGSLSKAESERVDGALAAMVNSTNEQVSLV
jgi:hypothetical protein